MIDRGLLFFGWALIIGLLMTQALPVTRLVFAPGQAAIVGDEVFLPRSFPGDRIDFTIPRLWGGGDPIHVKMPRPRLAYVETVRGLTPGWNGGHKCQDAAINPFRYTSPEPVGQWSIEWAAACISDPTAFVWQATWTAYLGVIPLGPVSREITVFGNGGGA